MLYLPLLRERLRRPRRGQHAAAAGAAKATIEHVKITDGKVVFSKLRDRVESRIEAINADAAIGRDRKVKVSGTARVGEHPTKFDIKATTPRRRSSGRPFRWNSPSTCRTC